MINLEAKEHLLDAVLEYCEDIVTVKDMNLHYIAYNKAFRRIIGASDDFTIMGKSVNEILDKESAETITKQSYKTISTLEIQTCMFLLKPTNRIIKQTITPIVKNGSLEGLLTVSSDVTNEETLKKELINKNLQLNSLIDNLPVLIYMKDKDRNLIVANEHSKRFVYEGVDIFADNLKLNMEDAEPETQNEDNYVLENKKQLIKEKSALDYSGKRHWYKINKAPILNENNEINGLVTIAKNIDAEKRLENQKGLFLATLSHDLKNPLLAQIYSLEHFYKQFSDKVNEDQREVLELIIESSKYMRDMLYTLLKTCKDSNGVIYLHRTNFDIESLVSRCVKEIKDMALIKNINIHIESNLSNPNIYADKTQIRRVIGNMLNNAINYGFEGTDLYINLYKNKDSISLGIKNNSFEISESLQANIFDKYVCGEDLQTNNGVGLGLYFCKKIVEAHDGEIKLVANGTENEFIVFLPIADEHSAFISEVVL